MTDPAHEDLCGHCWEPTSQPLLCEHCGQSVELRGERGTYRLEARLGEGASGVTFRARRSDDDQKVCVKALSFRGLTSFEAERVFTRETTTLRQLRHPQIPNYIDSFTTGHGRNLALVLVQDLVDGRDLAEAVKARRPSVDEVLDTLDELLSILEYLHGLAPPVIHRDIKPKNLMRRVDGRLVLIDFGAVKDAVHASFDPGMSLVGTVGYMAPEQLRGEATPASDLYSVGMLAVFLLSGREPATLIDDDHEVRWERAVSASAPVLAWLRAMTQRRPSERPASAAAARRQLEAARNEP
ncbi:MAG: serine/threonine protein kinase, partial [Deltaproteobacteria bacterium]|nr:serine/threonine protein kinase [Deltaproteobacteria bacterium]